MYKMITISGTEFDVGSPATQSLLTYIGDNYYERV